MRSKFTLSVSVTLMMCLAVLTACESGSHTVDEPDAPTRVNGNAGTYVGEVDDWDGYVGIVVHQTGEVLAYICDSSTVAQWFRGTAEGDILNLQSSQFRLEAAITADSASGAVTLSDGRRLTFKALAATGDGGLYRGLANGDGRDYVGGWVVLADGRQQGAILSTAPAPEVLGSTGSETSPAGSSPATPGTPFARQLQELKAQKIAIVQRIIGKEEQIAGSEAAGATQAAKAKTAGADTTPFAATPTPEAVVASPIVISAQVTLNPIRVSSTGTKISLK